MAIAPTLSWENGVVQEPNVFYDGTTYHMVYTGGFNTTALGHATASSLDGTWTKDANPFLGQGHGGEAGNVAHANVYVEGTTVYYYYPDSLNGGNIKVATAALSTPTTTTVVGQVLAIPSGTTGAANSYVVKDGTTYRMLFDARNSSPVAWEMGYATATSPTGTFTVQNYPLNTGLQVASGGSYGGPWFVKSSSTWILWYHSTPASGDLPTDIYRATSTDLVTWTRSSGGLAEIPRRAYEEYDQTADAFLIQDTSGQWYWFWDGMKNTSTQWGYIMRSIPIGSSLTL